ncbi:MAG: 3-hydroxyacyl-CoA dehydrogenase NAD-binding domain-containing protein [Pirellulaceae bacterium]
MIQYTASDGLAILCLRVPPVNALSFALLDELLAAIRRAANDPQVHTVVLTGGSEHFSAGADLAVFREIESVEDAMRVSQIFQAAFQEIEDSPKPVVAALAGHVLGGALELAMACHFRVAAQGSRFSMPEVRLGINPGAGGTQRLPRLVGPEVAIDMLLSAQPIDAERALALGLVTAVCAPDMLVSCAASVCSSSAHSASADSTDATACRSSCNAGGLTEVAFRKTSQRNERIRDAAANRAAFAKADKLIAAGRPEIIAPRKIAEVVRIGIEQSFEAGLRGEQVAFGQCMDTRAARNKIYLFCASRQAAKSSDQAGQHGAESPATVRIARAGVLGMGTMGTGIAQALVAAGISVTACDESQAALDRADQKIRDSLSGRVRQGKLTAAQAEQMAGRLRVTTDWQSLADAQLIVEAVFEDAQVKRAAIGRLEAVCAAETLIATNTSTLNLDLLAADMQRPERFVGMHFFHPAQHMPLVEIIRRDVTPPQVVAAAVRFARALGKTPVLVRNREGFLVNRLFVPYLKEAFWLLEEGFEPSVIDRAMVDFGFAMGPLALIDMSGLDILVLTDNVLRAAFPQHGPLSSIALTLVERGCLGQKTGSGVYRYETGDHTPHASDVAAEIIARARRERGDVSAGKPSEEIVNRLTLRMVAEAFRVLEEGIVERPADIDVAMVLGTGLADFRGGVLKYACDEGLNRVLEQLQEFAGTSGERYAPCDLLRAAAADPRVLKL